MRLLLIGFIGCFITITAMAFATAPDDLLATPEASADLPGWAPAGPPSGRVARVSLVSGEASVATSGGWINGVVNRPLAPGSTMRTRARARAEIDLGTATIDLAPVTQLTIKALNDHLVEFAVVEGRVFVALRQLDGDEKVEIEVSGQGVQLVQPGRYDIDASTGRIAVLAGQASLVGLGSDSDVAAGEQALLAGTGPTPVTIEPAARDEFVDWFQSRASAAAGPAALYYVSPYMTGFSELDAAGNWEDTTEYGAVWFPRELPADWAPYRNGRWNWIMPWGWTWIDDQPWGFAPFHYGRWALVGEHWAWVPGSFVAHPMFAPAVVAFLGTPSVGLSVADASVPAVAWFPLAPGEAYWPAYTADLAYVRRLNLGNVRDLEAIRLEANGEPPLEVFDQHFANRRFAGVVPRPIFVSGGAVAPEQLTLPEQRLENAPVLMGSPQIGPASHQIAIAANAAPRSAAKAAWTSHIAALVARNAIRAKILQTAFARLHDHAAVSRVRGAHLRAPAYAGAAPVRHTILLKVAHATKIPRR
jgi:hypothetical protein